METKLDRLVQQEIYELLSTEDKEALEERRAVAQRIVVGFPEEAQQANYTDAHTRIEPFGSQWGRGIVFEHDGELTSRVGSYETSHARLRQTGGNRSVLKTFYFGFDDGVLYLEHGSVGRNIDFKRDMVIEIAASIHEEGPLRGIAYRFTK